MRVDLTWPTKPTWSPLLKSASVAVSSTITSLSPESKAFEQYRQKEFVYSINFNRFQFRNTYINILSEQLCKGHSGDRFKTDR